jgi:5-carboxymethyl-2-hydroxymuconate isomerase
MPHLVILYTPNVEPQTDMTALCRTMADAMLQQRDDEGRQVFPTGGTRVLAFPAAHYAVADGQGDYAFVYLNVRMASGRTEAVKKRIGDALLAKVQQHFEPLVAQRHIGITLQIDEAPGQVYDAKYGNLHPLFNK